MDVITVESKAFKELEAKINAIADYVLNKQEAENINKDEIWVDSYEGYRERLLILIFEVDIFTKSEK